MITMKDIIRDGHPTLREKAKALSFPLSNNDKETLLAMPALTLDVALLHATKADKLGNCLVQSPDPFFDEHFARAAEKTYVSADEVVDRLELDAESAKYNFYERCFVAGVIETPCGAHPTSSVPNYGWDLAALKAYAASAKEENGWQDYFADKIAEGEEDYLTKFGGIETISELPAPQF